MIGVTEVAYCRGPTEYGGLKVQAGPPRHDFYTGVPLSTFGLLQGGRYFILPSLASRCLQ